MHFIRTNMARINTPVVFALRKLQEIWKSARLKQYRNRKCAKGARSRGVVRSLWGCLCAAQTSQFISVGAGFNMQFRSVLHLGCNGFVLWRFYGCFDILVCFTFSVMDFELIKGAGSGLFEYCVRGICVVLMQSFNDNSILIRNIIYGVYKDDIYFF